MCYNDNMNAIRELINEHMGWFWGLAIFFVAVTAWVTLLIPAYKLMQTIGDKRRKNQ